MIFSGYIHNELAERFRFPVVLLATSFMFGLFNSPLSTGDLSYVAHEFLSFFLLGIILGILFHMTRTLLCPMTFFFAFLLFRYFLPIKAVASAYQGLFFEVIALVSTLLLLMILTFEKRDSSDKSLEALLLET
jgi:membrane protease YdiL (CAAX protease family)